MRSLLNAGGRPAEQPIEADGGVAVRQRAADADAVGGDAAHQESTKAFDQSRRLRR